MSITRAVITNPDEGSAAVDGVKRLRQVWLVHTDSAFDTAFDIMAATLDGVPWLPRVGSPFYRWQYLSDDERYVPVLVDAGNPGRGFIVADPDVRVTLVEPRRLADDPTTWEVTVSYEANGSPTADIPKVSFGKVRFQKHVVADVRGMAITNSALDPYEGGVSVDRGRRSLTVARNVAYSAYDPLRTMEFEDTLNAKPYTLGTLRRTVYTTDPEYSVAAADPDRLPVLGPLGGVIGYSVPLRVPPGMARLVELTGWRQVTSRAATVAGSQFYWEVTAQLEIDRSVFTDEHGHEQYTRWRTVLADQGYRAFSDDGKQLTITGYGGHLHPHLLDGRGRKLPATGAGVDAMKCPPELAGQPIADVGAGMPAVDKARVPWPRHVWYAALKGQAMTVTAEQGLFTADGRRVATGVTIATDPEHGEVELDEVTVGMTTVLTGGFTYQPDDGYTGWDSFTYRLSGPAGTSNPATCVIKVGDRPKTRVFDTDREADWDPIAPLIGGW